jgi:hypothetical protein
MKDIKIDVVKPDGERVGGGSVDTNQDGAFSLTIGFSTLPPGHYEALAVGGGVRAMALFIFPVAPSPAP